MGKVRQIDYATPRTLVSYNRKRVVRTTGRDTRYLFEGELVDGVEDDHARLGEVRRDWQKSAFPVPWTDSPEVVRAPSEEA